MIDATLYAQPMENIHASIIKLNGLNFNYGLTVGRTHNGQATFVENVHTEDG